MLISGELYHDLWPDHFDRRAKAAQTHRLVTRLQNLGYAVQITPVGGMTRVLSLSDPIMFLVRRRSKLRLRV